MYSELVKRLRETSKDFGELDNVSVMLCEAAIAIEEMSLRAESYKRSVEAWADVAANAQPRWIPVTERLPDTDEYVLCWYEYYHRSKGKIFPEYGIGHCFNGMWSGEVSNGKDAKVLYWMPLPQPPKEDHDA